MKANEVRIGNLYYEGVNILKVRSITSYTTNRRQVEGMPSFLNYIPIEDSDITPIPLTEEWLVKFGFEHNRAGIWGNNYTLNALSIQLKGFGVYMFVNHPSCEIQYVHQLQNLYFALTGEELTIG